MDAFRPDDLSGVVVVCGHYGVGKTALSLALARDAAAGGKRVTLIDLDIVNPYFRSSDERAELERAGVAVVSPVHAGPTCNIDMPALTGAVSPAIEQARRCEGALAVVDVGGDDAGAQALGRFSRVVAQGDYRMLYVVNRFRALTQDPAEALGVLRDIEGACHLRATDVVDNSHLKGDTTTSDLLRGARFAQEVARRAGLPLATHVVAKRLAREAGASFLQNGVWESIYAMQPYSQTTWQIA